MTAAPVHGSRDQEFFHQPDPGSGSPAASPAGASRLPVRRALSASRGRWMSARTDGSIRRCGTDAFSQLRCLVSLAPISWLGTRQLIRRVALLD